MEGTENNLSGAETFLHRGGAERLLPLYLAVSVSQTRRGGAHHAPSTGVRALMAPELRALAQFRCKMLRPTMRSNSPKLT